MNTIIYSKYSNERNPKFAVRTDIVEEADGRRWVRKTPEYPEGEAHVQALYDQYQRLSAFTAGTKLAYNRCRLIPGGAELEYLTGISLENHLLSVVKEEGLEACAKEFLDYLNFVRSIHTGAFFESCEEFREVFGTVELPHGSVCSPCTNIDLLCENILLNDGKWTAIDYEWSFSFPIPVNFLLFRIIFYFTAHADRGAEFERFDFYGEMGISPEEI
ncbi:MAG: class I SAM-dependent methyltransferase, partial [Clostridiales bacterium]|nr:class I SAM-dependent methyltransferase [Clostridiales bacterium]